MRKIALFLLGLIASADSQAPSGTSLCDYYSAKINPGNATDAQTKWITQFVANVFGGNSSVFTGTTVQGVLSAGTYNNVPIRLTKYFDGTLYSTQGTNGLAQAVNWLDDGGVNTLAEGRLANSPTSNQYKLFSRFATLFSRVLQCTSVGSTNFTSTPSKPSLYEVHKFMSLDPNELGYFIEQVGGAGRVGGLTAEEATNITTRMSQGLSFRCRPPSSLTPGGALVPQSICTDKDCTLAPNAACGAYGYPDGISPDPAPVHGAAASPSPTPSKSATPSPPPSSKGVKVLPIALGVAIPVGVIALGIICFLIWRYRRKMSTLEKRLTRVEAGGTPSHGFGSSEKAPSFIAPSEPTIASYGQMRHSQAVSNSTVYDPHRSTFNQYSPETRPWSGEHFEPANQTMPIPVNNPSPQAAHSFPDTGSPGGNAGRPKATPLEME